MKLLHSLLIIGISVAAPGLCAAQQISSSHESGTIVVTARNTLQTTRPDECIELDLSRLPSRASISTARDIYVNENGKEIPSQRVINKRDFIPDKLIFVGSFAPNESKTFVVHFSDRPGTTRTYPEQTQAQLGMKSDYKKISGYYTGGRFVNVDSTTVPSDHFAHDALYRIEGPGWESKWIVYRFYLDSRNRTDIFGKKIHDMVLQRIGVNDLVSDSKESYTEMLDWGMDIFKVGESLGVGSVAIWCDSTFVTISDVSKVQCEIAEDGPLLSAVRAEYFGWKACGGTHDIATTYSIAAGSRLTRVEVSVTGGDPVMCTGVAIHDGCEVVESSPSDSVKWCFIGMYGKQSLAGDNLGTAVLYRKSDLVRLTSDSTSQIVLLKPHDGKLVYYFGAAWEQEPGGLKNKEEFLDFMKNESSELSNPIEVEY